MKGLNAAFFPWLLIFFLSSCAQASSSRPAAEGGPAAVPREKMILNFESSGITILNDLGGESGSWNRDPSDLNNSFCDESVVELPGPDGAMTRALRLNYSVDSEKESQNGFWTKLQDFDAQAYDHLAFHVKGDPKRGFTDKFKLEIKKCKSGHCTGEERRDEVVVGSVVVPVTEEWTSVEIPLAKLTGIIDFADPESWKDASVALRGLDQLTVVFRDRQVSEKTGTIYLDNIRFVRTGNRGPSAVDKPERKISKTPEWMEGLPYAQFLAKRLKGFPNQAVVKKAFPEDDREFLREIAKDTWRFFDEIVDRENALPLDTIQIAPEGVAAMAEGAFIGDYTNVTNVGIYFMALVSAVDLGFLPREEAVRRVQKTLATFEKLKTHESGFPYNYYDTTNLEQTDYLVSFVDSSWYLAGLYVVKNAFPEELGAKVQALVDRGKLAFFYDPVERAMYHGFYDHLGVYSNYHYGIFYAEHRAGSYMAIARGEVPAEHWFALTRTYPESVTWQQLKPEGRTEKIALGTRYFGGHYVWKDLKYVPSWGGAAFEALMPTLVLDEKRLAPEGLGFNDAEHVQGQIRYALEELQYPVWGMSPCSVPEGGYSEYGAAPFGSKGYKAGVVTPHASVLALEYAPEAVMKNLRKLLELYDIYGEYGFYDAVNVATGKVARKYLALDQGMIFVAINNYLNDGAVRKRFHADPVLKAGESLLTEEKILEAGPALAPAGTS